MWQLATTLFHGTDRQAGDTIVEVLIAVAIVSLVLAGSYAMVSKSTAATQNTQERSQAQQLVKAQIELLRNYYSVNNTAFSGRCFGTDGSVKTVAGDCIDNSPAQYQLAISPTGDTYTVSATWVSLGGSTSNVTMYYRPN